MTKWRIIATAVTENNFTPFFSSSKDIASTKKNDPKTESGTQLIALVIGSIAGLKKELHFLVTIKSKDLLEFIKIEILSKQLPQQS